MLRLFLLFIVLVAGVVLGPMIAGHQGYVLIQTDSYQIETSVTGLALIAVVLLVAVLLVVWLLRVITQSGGRAQRWFSLRRRKLADRQTQEALLKLAEGDYQQMEKLLTRNADYAPQPEINYLLAAEAAQQSGDTVRSQEYLHRASKLAPLESLPVGITRIRLQLAQGNVSAARQEVEQLLKKAPRHPELLRLAKQAYLRSEHAGALLEILPSMRKIRLYDEQQLQELEQQAHIALMHQTLADNGVAGLKSWWPQQSRKTRQDTVIQLAMIDNLIRCGEPDMAQQILLKSLKKNFNPLLLAPIERLNSGNPQPLEQLLRQQIKQHGTTPLLNATLGKLLMSHGEWQQAYDALQAAVEQHPDPHHYDLLAEILDKLQRHAEADNIRRLRTTGKN